MTIIEKMTEEIIDVLLKFVECDELLAVDDHVRDERAYHKIPMIDFLNLFEDKNCFDAMIREIGGSEFKTFEFAPGQSDYIEEYLSYDNQPEWQNKVWETVIGSQRMKPLFKRLFHQMDEAAREALNQLNRIRDFQQTYEK
jgi:hypothetical protein